MFVTDDKSKSGAAYRQRISLSGDHEVLGREAKVNVKEDRRLQAVESVGSLGNGVDREFRG